MADLPSPLFNEALPAVAPDPDGAALLDLLRPAFEAVWEGGVDEEETERRLDIARHAAYAQATAAMEDGWRLRRVVQVEEWTAEVARRGDDWGRAYRAWRTAFWIRHQAGDDIARTKLVLDHLRDLAADRPPSG